MSMSKDEILRKLATKELTVEAASAMLSEMENKTAMHCKASVAGAVSVYGLQRMPVTLYKSQWLRLIAFVPEIEKFMAEQNGSLSTGKDDTRFDAAKAAAKAKYAKS